MAIAATSLMIRVAARSASANISRGLTICLIWMTSGLFDLLLFERAHNRSDDELLIKLLAVSCILGLLGIIATPILKRIAPGDGVPHKAILERGTIQTAITPGWDAGVSPSQSLSRRTERFSVALVPVLDVWGTHYDW